MTQRRVRLPPISIRAAAADLDAAVDSAVRRALAGRPGMTATDRETVARATIAALTRRLRAVSEDGA